MRVSILLGDGVTILSILQIVDRAMYFHFYIGIMYFALIVFNFDIFW